MIATEFYKGQGLGNQLFCYVATRIIAKSNGYEFSIMRPELFKANDFIDLDFGQIFLNEKDSGITNHYVEKKLLLSNDSDIRVRDEKLIKIKDGTKIDGYMQDVEFIINYKEEIKKWLKVKEEFECYDYSKDNICVINFRGGEYAFEKDFFLHKKYWIDSVAEMLKINPDLKFIVITDDEILAKKIFPKFEVHHFNVAKDYSIIKNAHYLILSNSSFGWFPAWLSETVKFCIAPKYWGRHNISLGYWSLGYSLTPSWNYLDRDGKMSNFESCKKEWDEYFEKNKSKFLSEINKKENVFGKIWKPISALISVSAEAKSFGVFLEMAKRLLKKPLRKIIEKLTALKKNIPKDSKLISFYKKVRDILKYYLRKIIESTRIPDIISSSKERKSRKNWLPLEEIKEYRNKIKIYDIFTFFNELDLLEIRFNILDPYVDYFVILEANKTYSGIDKPYYFKENKDRYKKWENKIIHYTVDDVPESEDDLRRRLYDKNLSQTNKKIILDSLTSKSFDRSVFAWCREFYIKESLKKALVDLKDHDICYVSDLDEIWNPGLLIDYSKDEVFKPILNGYMYYLNNRSDEHWRGWTGTIVTKYKNIKNSCLNELRNYGVTKYILLKNGGWHFNFLGGYEGAKRKIEEANHFWYNPKGVLPILENKVLKNKDHRGKVVALWKEEKDLPRYLLENKEKYKKFFK